MTIKEGEIWVCIKDVYMKETREHAYVKNSLYLSELDHCLTDELGVVEHYWNGEAKDILEKYFRRWNHKRRKIYGIINRGCVVCKFKRRVQN